MNNDLIFREIKKKSKKNSRKDRLIHYSKSREGRPAMGYAPAKEGQTLTRTLMHRQNRGFYAKMVYLYTLV